MSKSELKYVEVHELAQEIRELMFTMSMCLSVDECKGMNRAKEVIAKLIENGNGDESVIKLPCKIGDEVWCIREYRGVKHPQKTEVSGMYFTQDMRLIIQCRYVGMGEFGKKVFSTYEEASASINGEVDSCDKP